MGQGKGKGKGRMHRPGGITVALMVLLADFARGQLEYRSPGSPVVDWTSNQHPTMDQQQNEPGREWQEHAAVDAQGCPPNTDHCPLDLYEPLCGSDGMTYMNPCEFAVASCREPGLGVMFEEQCKLTRGLFDDDDDSNNSDDDDDSEDLLWLLLLASLLPCLCKCCCRQGCCQQSCCCCPCYSCCC